MFLGSLCFFLYLIIYVKEFFLSCVCRSSCHHSKEKEQFRKWTGKSINVSHFLCCCCKIFKVRLTILGYYALGLSLCWVTRVSLAVDEQNGGLKKLNIPFILVSIFIAFFTFEKVWNQVDIILRANVLYILRKENLPPSVTLLGTIFCIINGTISNAICYEKSSRELLEKQFRS